MNAWQPIETAPKDGTVIFGLVESREPEVMWWGNHTKFPWTVRDSGGFPIDMVTHWLPVPPLPQPPQ